MTILDTLTAVAGALEGAGIPATIDPALFPQLVTQHGVAALVEAPTPTGRLLAGRVDLEVPVWLCGATNDLPGITPVWAAIPTLVTTLRPNGASSPGAYRSGDITLPGYQFNTHHRAT